MEIVRQLGHQLYFESIDCDYICSKIEEVKDALKTHGTICLKNIHFVITQK